MAKKRRGYEQAEERRRMKGGSGTERRRGRRGLGLRSALNRPTLFVGKLQEKSGPMAQASQAVSVVVTLYSAREEDASTESTFHYKYTNQGKLLHK